MLVCITLSTSIASFWSRLSIKQAFRTVLWHESPLPPCFCPVSRVQVLQRSMGPVPAVCHPVLLPAGLVLPSMQGRGAHGLLLRVPEQGPARGGGVLRNWSRRAQGEVWVHRPTAQNSPGCAMRKRSSPSGHRSPASERNDPRLWVIWMETNKNRKRKCQITNQNCIIFSFEAYEEMYYYCYYIDYTRLINNLYSWNYKIVSVVNWKILLN